MSWFWVFVGFCLLIVLHEAGHFFAAKARTMFTAGPAATTTIRFQTGLRK